MIIRTAAGPRIASSRWDRGSNRCAPPDNFQRLTGDQPRDLLRIGFFDNADQELALCLASSVCYSYDEVKYSADIKTGLRCAAIWLLIAAVAILLITPQVDFPDAVSSGTAVLVSGLNHANSAAGLAFNALTIIVQLRVLVESAAFRHSPISAHAGANYILVRLCALRC